MSVDDRLDEIERRLDALRVPPVRDELLALRDVHGARLSAIDARLTAIERDTSETESWLVRRFDAIDGSLAAIVRELAGLAGGTS